jgi:hypothetical protein
MGRLVREPAMFAPASPSMRSGFAAVRGAH